MSSISSTVSIISQGPEMTREVGRILGQHARPGDIFLLTGPLGAGKTCLTQGIAWGLGVEGYARSPTFVIVTRYMGRLTLHHIDLFRIQDAQEAWDLGMEEYLSGEGVCVVEWADRASEIFPPESTWIALEYGDRHSPDSGNDGEETMERLITINAPDGRYEGLLEALKDQAGQGNDVSD